MIEKLTIRNFKRFDSVTFDIPHHVVLAGPNNCGKTTALQAVAAWALALDRWKQLNDFQRHGDLYRRAPISRHAFYSVPLRSFDALWTHRDYHRGTIEIEVKSRDGWSITMELNSDSTEQIYVWPKGDAAPETLREAKLDVVFIPAMGGLSTAEPVYQPPKIAQLLGQGKPGDVLRNLLVEANHLHVWDDLCASIRRMFGYELAPPDAAAADIVAEYREKPGLPLFDIASAGSGFQQVLMLMTFLYTRPASVLLLDEPDAHLHVILQDMIYGELQDVAIRQRSQLIIATHSEVIINSVAPEELCLVINKPRVLSSTADRTRLADALRVLTNLDVIQAESAKGVLFTEDFTDLAILREWARILEHPVFDALFRHVMWKKAVTQQREDASGIKARDYYDKLLLVRDDLPGVELIDSDGKTAPASSPVTGQGLQRLRWKRYEIESYLFHPEALARFVSQQVGAGAAAEYVARLRAYLQQTQPPAFLQNPHADLAFLLGTKARTDLLPPALTAAGLPAIEYTSYHEIAALMLPEEIHPEVKEKLDLIQQALRL